MHALATPAHDYTDVAMTRSSTFTRSDYMRLPEGFPAELIDGMLVKEPSPTPWHQRLVTRIPFELESALDKERILVSPIDFFIDDTNILQPDVVVLRAGEIPGPDEREISVPLIVFEVLSPSTARRDRVTKARKYLEAGVREVWLVDPETETIEVRTADASKTVHGSHAARSTAEPSFRITPQELFRH